MEKGEVTEPVVWSIAPHPASRGGMPGVRVKAEIAPGYHLYSVTQEPGGPNPTIIAPAPGQLFGVMDSPRAWPKPQCLFDPKFGMETEYHVGSVIFDVHLRAEAGLLPGPREVVLQVEYQLCDEDTCLRPEVTELRTVVSVEPAALKTSTPPNGW